MTSEGKQSLVEAVTNVAVGFLLALLMQIAIFPVFGLVVSVADNRLIGTILTIVPSRLVSHRVIVSADEIASSAVARNTFILLQQAIERGGLPLTATGNLSRAVVAEMRELIKWPGYDKTDAFRLHKVTNLTFCRCTSSVWSQRQPSSCPHGAASWCRSGNRCSAMRGRGAYRRSCSILRSGTWIPGISAAGYRFGEPHF